jgi:N-formylglutamate amidohydrolase
MVEKHATDDLFWGPSPLVIHVPHSSVSIPEDVRADLLLDDTELDAELRRMTDWETNDIAYMALHRSGLEARVVENAYSRLVVDPERFIGDDEPMAAIGMGPVYHSTSDLRPLRAADPARDEALLNEYFHPYAQTFSDVVDQVLSECGRVTIVDLHSFPSLPLPYEVDQSALRPGICIGTDPFHTPDVLRDAAVESFAGMPGGIALNTPFSGTYVPLEHLGRTPEVSSVMVEIRRDLYQVEPGGPRHEGFRDVITGLVRFLSKAVWIGA